MKTSIFTNVNPDERAALARHIIEQGQEAGFGPEAISEARMVLADLAAPDLTQHPNPGVRWQAQMEESLAVVRERLHVLSRMSSVTAEVEAMQLHATVAQAAASAALALAIANAGSDLELVFDKLTDAVQAVADIRATQEV